MSSKVFLSEENSSWQNVKQSWQSLHKGRLCLVVLCVIFLLSGCASKEKTVVTPKKASLGGVQLTAKEKEILYSTGQLDKNIPAAGMPAIAKQYSRFLYGSRPTMENFAQRSEDYLGHARDIFRKNGMPEELAYLALVESGYRHTAKSHAGAAGTWQFMPYTGKHFGLQQDRYIDERLDPYESVEAAAKYLKQLHNMFGDWLLAIAAYNAGQGKIKRALEGTGANDFFTMVARNERLTGKTKLRLETMVYVPRFLAMTKIMRNLGPLGFTPVNHNQAPLHARFKVAPSTDLRDLARAVGVPYHEFREANAQHKGHVTHRNKNTYVNVPKGAQSAAQRYIASGKSGRSYRAQNTKAHTPVVAHNAQVSSSKTHYYVVKKGDSLSRIAAKYDTTTATLVRVNKLDSVATVRIGQKLTIPGRAKAVATRAVAHSKKRTHVVKYGDTVGAIAQKYNMSTKQLLKLNKKSSADIRAGEKLLVSSL